MLHTLLHLVLLITAGSFKSAVKSSVLFITRIIDPWGAPQWELYNPAVTIAVSLTAYQKVPYLVWLIISKALERIITDIVSRSRYTWVVA